MARTFPPTVQAPYPVHVLGRAEDYGIPSPRWLDFHAPGWAPPVRVSEGRVGFCGRDWPFAGSSLPDGVEVLAWFDPRAGVVACVTVAGHAAWLAWEAARAEAERGRRETPLRAEAERRRREAREWLSRFEPPFRWTLGHKPVLSGLSERSAGDGANAASVEHVMLDAPFRAGRLARRAGDMLCSARSGAYDNRADRQPPADRMPTCRACLAMAARWLRPDAS